MSDEEQSFDIDAGVDAIAADMGWESTDSDGEDSNDLINEEENNDGLQQEQKTKTAEEVAEETQEVTAKAPPASWAKDRHESWAKIPPEAQEYIELREKQMLDGIEQYKQGHAFGHEVARAVEPFRDMLQAHGVNEIQAISNLMQWNQTLQTGSLEQRQQAFIALGTDLGLIPQEGHPQIDPRTQELQQRLDRIERENQQRQQQEYQQNIRKVSSEVEAFAGDPANQYFEEVADDVVAMLQSDKNLGLKDAYDRAVWANPITRAKEQARLIESETKTRSDRQTVEAKAAMKANGVNVRPLKTNVASSEPVGSWEDTLSETLSSIKSRA